MAKDRIPEDELQHDAFVGSIDHLIDYYKNNKSTVQWFVLCAITLVILGVVVSKYREHRKHAMQQAFEAATTIESINEFLDTYNDDRLIPLVLLQKGNMLFDKKDYKGALEAYTLIEDQYPHHEVLDEALLGMGYAYIELGEFTKASGAFEGFINKYPDSAFKTEAQINLARTMMRIGNYPKAREIVETIITDEPNSLVADDAKELLPLIERKL